MYFEHEEDNQYICIDIIFCKECIWYDPSRLRCNNTRTTEWDPDNFCSSGERKEDSDDRIYDLKRALSSIYGKMGEEK